MTHQITTTITGVTRRTSSSDGNPRYTVNTTAGTWTTVKDGSVAYGITNSEYQGEVILTLDKEEIIGVSTVDGQYFTGRQT